MLPNTDVCVWRQHMRRNQEQRCSKRQQASSHRMHVKQAPAKPHQYLCLCVLAALWILQRRWDDCFSHHSRVSALFKSTRHLARIFVSAAFRVSAHDVHVQCSLRKCLLRSFSLFLLSSGCEFEYLWLSGPSFSMSTAVFQSESWWICWISIPCRCKRRKISVFAVAEVNRSFKVTAEGRSHLLSHLYNLGSHLGSHMWYKYLYINVIKYKDFCVSPKLCFFFLNVVTVSYTCLIWWNWFFPPTPVWKQYKTGQRRGPRQCGISALHDITKVRTQYASALFSKFNRGTDGQLHH